MYNIIVKKILINQKIPVVYDICIYDMQSFAVLSSQKLLMREFGPVQCIL